MNACSRSAFVILISASAAGMLAPVALADPQPSTPQPSAPQTGAVPCGVLDQVQESLDDDVSAGIDGLRVVLQQPYLSGTQQAADANGKVAMIAHGVSYMRDVSDDQVPGFGRSLGHLDNTVNDLQNALQASQLPPDWKGRAPLMHVSPVVFEDLDQADQQQSDLSDILNQARAHCS